MAKRIPKAELERIRASRINVKSVNLHEDTILVITGITGRKKVKKGCKFKVHWQNYNHESWVAAEIVPQVFWDYYINTGNVDIPAPRIKATKKHGTIVEHQLVFEDDSLPVWTNAGELINISNSIRAVPCNFNFRGLF